MIVFIAAALVVLGLLLWLFGLAVYAVLITVACLGLVVWLVLSWRIILRESDRADTAEDERDEALEERDSLRIENGDLRTKLGDALDDEMDRVRRRAGGPL